MSKMKTSDFVEILEMLMGDEEQKVVPFVQGKPGIGKSAIIRQIADKLNYVHFLDIRLSQHDSTDLKGIPQVVDGLLQWVPPEFMPLNGSKYDDGNSGILFFDEINRASVEVLQSVFEIIHDRRIGMRPILSNWFIVAAGNYGYEDGTDVVEMDSALKNRFQLIELESPNFWEWKNWAEQSGVNQIIIDYLEQNPGNLHYEDKEYNSDELVTPRTWEKFSHILNQHIGDESKVSELMSHTFIKSIAPTFNEFIREYSGVRAKDVIVNYQNIKDEIDNLDRHRVIELMDKIDQFIQNTPIDDVSGFSNFVKNHLTQDNQVTMIVKLTKTDAGRVILKKFLKDNPDMDNMEHLEKKVREAFNMQ